MVKVKSLAEVARRRMSGAEEVDEGFTLIELLVVLLIIGILLAIAIPTFLSVTQSANDTAAQANLQTALTGAKTWYTQNNQTYQAISLGPVDTGLSLVSGGSSNSPHVVSYSNATVGGAAAYSTFVAASYASGTHVCWGIIDMTSAPTASFDGLTAAGTTYAGDVVSGASACKASLFTTAIANVAKTSGYSTTGFGPLTQSPTSLP